MKIRKTFFAASGIAGIVIAAGMPIAFSKDHREKPGHTSKPDQPRADAGGEPPASTTSAAAKDSQVPEGETSTESGPEELFAFSEPDLPVATTSAFDLSAPMVLPARQDEAADATAHASDAKPADILAELRSSIEAARASTEDELDGGPDGKTMIERSTAKVLDSDEDDQTRVR